MQTACDVTARSEVLNGPSSQVREDSPGEVTFGLRLSALEFL